MSSCTLAFPVFSLACPTKIFESFLTRPTTSTFSLTLVATPSDISRTVSVDQKARHFVSFAIVGYLSRPLCSVCKRGLRCLDSVFRPQMSATHAGPPDSGPACFSTRVLTWGLWVSLSLHPSSPPSTWATGNFLRRSQSTLWLEDL